MNNLKILNKIKTILIVFIFFLLLSGITAFPIETELKIINENMTFLPEILKNWLEKIYFAVKFTNKNYPFLSYGTDWLAFAHLVIAIAFIGPLRDPVKNIWVIEFGIISCILIIPLALIAGYIREIPWFWQLIDCSFGIFGLVPLLCSYRLVKRYINTNNC